MPGSQYFHDKKKANLNSSTNADGAARWAPDAKYTIEAADVLKRGGMDLHEGILLKFEMMRNR